MKVNNLDYQYITDNNFINKQKYNYSIFKGSEFINAYKASRQFFLKTQAEPEKTNFHYAGIDLLSLLMDEKDNKSLLDCYVKMFEVRKVLFDIYDEQWKPIESDQYYNYENYFLLAECCIHMYERTECVKYLSCLLKLVDTLISVHYNLSAVEKKKLAIISAKELQLVKTLGIKMKVEV